MLMFHYFLVSKLVPKACHLFLAVLVPFGRFETLKQGGVSMQLGYARVSTPDQSMDLQKDALEAAGVKEIFEDVGSGVRAKQTGLEAPRLRPPWRYRRRLAARSPGAELAGPCGLNF